MLNIMFKTFLNYWKKFAYFIGRINTKIIFTVIYLFVFGIYYFLNLPFRIFKSAKIRKLQTQSFWQKKNSERQTLASLQNQF